MTDKKMPRAERRRYPVGQDPRREARREHAVGREASRAARTDEQQMAALDERKGRSARERARLTLGEVMRPTDRNRS